MVFPELFYTQKSSDMPLADYLLKSIPSGRTCQMLTSGRNPRESGLQVPPTNPRSKITLEVDDYEQKASLKKISKKRQGHF
jgi:hypothetical protein